MRLFNRTERYADGSSYTYRWYECNPFYQLSLARWSFTKKGWHPKAKRLARLRCLYWTLIRLHNTEICACCGGPVGLVYHAPDAIWEAATGYGGRSPGGESAHGVLCPQCLSQLAKEAGLPFLRWTCAIDDSVLVAA
jgi:hypothetical protein